MLGGLSVLAALAVGARMVYPRFIERRARRRRPLGVDGFIVGVRHIDLPRPDAPAALLLHGGGDTPQVLGALATHLHGRGFAVRAPVLPGHGRTLASFGDFTAAELSKFVEREYDDLRVRHRWVAVVGLSMGGALAIRLAAERHDIPALVLLAPYIAMPAGIRRLAATSGAWGWLLPYFSSRGGESIRDEQAAAETLGHGIFTPAALRALLGVVSSAEAALPGVRAPTRVIQSRTDNRISVSDAEAAFARLGAPAKELIWTEGAGHVITVDFGRELVFQLTAEWLERHHGVSRPQTKKPVP